MVSFSILAYSYLLWRIFKVSATAVLRLLTELCQTCVFDNLRFTADMNKAKDIVAFLDEN